MKFIVKLIFIYIFILGLAFTFLVPPLQKPDEHGHFIRSILLSHGKIILTNKDEELPIEKQYFDLIHDPLLNKLPYHPNTKFDLRWYKRAIFAEKDAYKLVNESTWGQFMLPASSYIPHSIGIIIARLLHLNAYLTFFMGRFAMFLLAFVWMIFLYRKTPQTFKPILLFVFSLPMLIHQITGYNYDAIQYMVGFSLFVLMLNLLQKKKLIIYDFCLLAVFFIFFLITKLSFEPMLLLIFLIPFKKIDAKLANYAKKMALLLTVILLGYFIAKSPFFISASNYTHHPKGVNPVLQAQYILHNPIHYVQIFTQSTIHLAKFHIQGIIGLFGWLDYSLDWWMYFVFIATAGYIIYKVKLKRNEFIETWQILLIACSLFLTYSFMMTIFYLNWKMVGSRSIDGTQGRYFIVFVPFILYLLLQLKYKLKLCKNCS